MSPRQKESRVEEGHLMPDHVHMVLRIPPKYVVMPQGRDEQVGRRGHGLQ
jgi:REP element-mobilizing transposase RayT